ELKVQWGTGREPGGSDVSDHLPLGHMAAGVNSPGESAQVSVPRGNAVAMADLDQVAVAAGHPGPEHDTVARSHDRRPRCGSVVGSFVMAPGSQDRVVAGTAEARRDPAELDR